MSEAESRSLPQIDPSALGPLGDAPVAAGEPAVVFAGETRFLSPRHVSTRRKLVDAVASRVSALIEPGERLLHVAPAAAIPPLTEQLGFGALWRRYNTVALVVTDRRIVEVLLDDNGKKPGTRTLSYPLARVRSLKMGRFTLTLRPAAGRAKKWRLSVGGDRRLLWLLVPRISEMLLHAGDNRGGASPVWHCPTCCAASETRPSTCAACGTTFASPGLAAGLALAIPGGGLFFVGRRVLGALDLLGEAVVAALIWVQLLFSSDAGHTAVAAGTGAFLLVLTKSQSVHLSRIFARRTLPMRAATATRWRRAAFAGATLSAVVIATPLVLAGSFKPRAEHDLEFVAADLGWSGGHDPSTWKYSADEGQRSEWTHKDGWSAFVFTIALGPFESFDDLRRDFTGPDHDRLVGPDETIAAGLRGVRVVERARDAKGKEYRRLRYFLDDRDVNDVHVVLAMAEPDELPALEGQMRALMATARLVPAVKAEAPKPSD